MATCGRHDHGAPHPYVRRRRRVAGGPLRLVRGGHLFGWRESDDCLVRHQVTEVQPDPAGTVPRKLPGAERMTHAFTGCGGAVPAEAAVSLDWGDLPVLGRWCFLDSGCRWRRGSVAS